VREVLTHAWRDKLYVQSNLARRLAVAIGIAASCGWITTKHGPLFGRQWFITSKGLKWLEENYES
jgi:hypothetical protein